MRLIAWNSSSCVRAEIHQSGNTQQASNVFRVTSLTTQQQTSRGLKSHNGSIRFDFFGGLELKSRTERLPVCKPETWLADSKLCALHLAKRQRLMSPLSRINASLRYRLRNMHKASRFTSSCSRTAPHPGAFYTRLDWPNIAQFSSASAYKSFSGVTAFFIVFCNFWSASRYWIKIYGGREENFIVWLVWKEQNNQWDNLPLYLTIPLSSLTADTSVNDDDSEPILCNKTSK